MLGIIYSFVLQTFSICYKYCMFLRRGIFNLVLFYIVCPMLLLRKNITSNTSIQSWNFFLIYKKRIWKMASSTAYICNCSFSMRFLNFSSNAHHNLRFKGYCSNKNHIYHSATVLILFFYKSCLTVANQIFSIFQATLGECVFNLYWK